MRFARLVKFEHTIFALPFAYVGAFLADNAVTVNGEPENRRGRQLHPGDVVVADGEELRLIAASS